MQVTLSKGEIQRAASAGARLLLDPDVKVPAPMAVAGDYKTLHVLLSAIASGKLDVVESRDQEEMHPNLHAVGEGGEG